MANVVFDCSIAYEVFCKKMVLEPLIIILKKHRKRRKFEDKT